MSYASALKTIKFKPYAMTPTESAYAFKCRAQWGDIASYDPKEDGKYEEFFLESARKRCAVVKPLPTDEELEAERERIRELAVTKERLREQAKQRTEETIPKCKCGCGRPVHRNPSPEFIGYCCGWCKKHKGRRGHGESCGK
jgi:hypothetical protein